MASCGGAPGKRITIDPATVRQARTPPDLLKPPPALQPLPDAPPNLIETTRLMVDARAKYRICAAQNAALVTIIEVEEGVAKGGGT